jgi:hypothetical protein
MEFLTRFMRRLESRADAAVLRRPRAREKLLHCRVASRRHVDAICNYGDCWIKLIGTSCGNAFTAFD